VNLPRLSDRDDTWGHCLEPIENCSTFRVLLQNPNGITFHDRAFQYKYGLSNCRHQNAVAICIAETKLNTTHNSALTKLWNIHAEIFSNSFFQVSQTPDTFTKLYQPWGTLTLLCESWASRIEEKGSDPFNLGRWSYLILRGKGTKRIVIITAYRVSADLAGPMTATMQQYRKISKVNREDNRVSRPLPRHQFILDLQAWLETLVSKEYLIIMALDANDDYYPNAGSITPLTYTAGKHVQNAKRDGTLATLCKTCGLVDPFTNIHTHSPPPSTYMRGSSRLDYVFISWGLLSAVERAGILPYNSIFFGDHRPCFLDFNALALFQEESHPLAPLSRRGLQLHNPKKVTQYLESLDHQHFIKTRFTVYLRSR